MSPFLYSTRNYPPTKCWCVFAEDITKADKLIEVASGLNPQRDLICYSTVNKTIQFLSFLSASTVVAIIVKHLSYAQGSSFAGLYVQYRMEFFQHFNTNKYVSSTSHGGDYFTNLLNTINGVEWEEKGPYGKNFNLLAKTFSENHGASIVFVN